MKMVCGFCQNEFESAEDDPRCPKCLRRQAAAKGRRRAAEGLAGDFVGAPAPPERPFKERLGRFAARSAVGALVFTLLTAGGRLSGMDLSREPWLQVYAIGIGGLMLGGAWSLFPRLSPIYRE